MCESGQARHTEGKKSLNDCAVTSAKCMRQKHHVNGSLIASQSPSHVPPNSSSTPPLEQSTLYSAISVSSALIHRVLCGQSGSAMKATAATMIETPPSMMKNHCQEVRPAVFFMPVRIPAARKPEMMFEIVFPACQIAIRRGFSVLVYQEEVTVWC